VVVQNSYISNANQAIPLFDELIKKIRALDYCVPGPNPNWATVGQQNLTDALTLVAPYASPDSNSQTAENQNQDYYANAIFDLTEIEIQHSTSMHNHSQFLAFMNNVFAKYSERMMDQVQGYPTNIAPPSGRVLLYGLLQNLQIYEASLEDLTNYLANVQSYLPTLIGIQSTLNQIQQSTGNLDPNNPQVQAQISLFNSISSHFATEPQLATLVNTIPYLQSQITSLNGYLNTCIEETVNQPYPYASGRLMYPTPYFPYTQTVSPFTALPAPNDTFLQGVDFGTGPNDIDVNFQGVEVSANSDGLQTFETTIQSVY
jgi:hypothetical protein